MLIPDPIFKKWSILKINDNYTWQISKLYYKLQKDTLPSYFTKLKAILQNTNDHGHNTRNKHKFKIIKVKHEFARYCLRFQLITQLNKMSDLVKGKINTHGFPGFS
jgi:hypothetical protein